ncbi:MAG TPA: tetratricopeptide repeat protein [Ignavibacteriaceae bacterium]|nr:tetratricopeptide repeat protein [Ignavibacteriaceae bacterium]
MKYFILSVLFTGAMLLDGCSSKSADDYMKAAKQNVMNKNMTEAVSNYQSVVNEFPESPQAPEALFQVATLYQNKMVTNLSDKESFKKAEETFREVYNKYPDDSKAPMALFLSGFILANDLKNFESATSTYNLFLEKYPKHELATSAREELQNMGLSPDQILQNKSQKNI